MFFPDIINYLLTLRYPGSEIGRQNWVCYKGAVQIIVPLGRPGATASYSLRPLHGVYAWLAYLGKFGTDMVPNSLSGTISQYGTTPYSGVLSQRVRDDAFEYFILVTEQEPTYLSITNLSSLAARGEIIHEFLVIPTPQDLVTILDALRRLHTSTESEQLLRQAVYLLEVLSGKPQKPRTPIGGSS